MEHEGEKEMEKKQETGSDLTPPTLRKAVGSADGQTSQEKSAESAAPAPDPHGALASEKAKIFLEKKREENSNQIRERLGQDNMIYNAIQVNTKRANVAADLLGGPKSTVENMRGLVDIGDGRILSGGLKIDIADKKVVCTSFDQEWRCLACNHTSNRPAFGIRGRATVSETPHVVLLADQSVPATMPVNSDKHCVKIFIVENGSLREIVEELFKMLGNRRVPKGSAILLYSAAYMAEAGIVAYVEEFLAVRAMIHEKIGKATRVLPLLPILLGGCDKPDAIRGLYELMAWSDDYFSDEDGYLEATTALVRELLNDQGSGSKQAKEFRRVLLPDKGTTNGKKAWNSGGYFSPELPTIIRAMTTSMEKKWMTSLVDEIRTKLALDLDPNPTLERGMGLQSRANRKVDFLVVGGSNAARLTRMLNDAGYTFCSIIDITWRITHNNYEALAAMVATQIQLEDPGTIVLQLLDNSYYYTKGPDGSRTLPVREQDGKFHVLGDLVLCSAETQIDHLQALTPVLDAAGKRPCLIVSPLPRFVI
jgi:hypothetical protein